jgi:EAL domain-containing protein (putative c-di-GMP-specific phosphodiesterase class I)
MYDAKRRGGHRCQMIDLGRDDGAAARRALARDLAGAIERREIRPDYQPIVQTVDGRVTAVEALAHWDHPVRGPLGPAQCAPLAGRFGLVAEYERAILEQACSDRSGWSRAGRSVGLAVDVATPHLLLPGFPAMVAEALDATGTEPATLMLEMDEDAAAEHGERVAPVLERLRALGVGLAIEGFGTARSSLASLRNLEVDEVKLDSRLVGELPRDPASHAMVFATTELAHLLGMVVVAEGVETEEQRHQVTLLGCDYSQGRYFFPPVRADELSPLLA